MSSLAVCLKIRSTSHRTTGALETETLHSGRAVTAYTRLLYGGEISVLNALSAYLCSESASRRLPYSTYVADGYYQVWGVDTNYSTVRLTLTVHCTGLYCVAQQPCRELPVTSVVQAQNRITEMFSLRGKDDLSATNEAKPWVPDDGRLKVLMLNMMFVPTQVCIDCICLFLLFCLWYSRQHPLRVC